MDPHGCGQQLKTTSRVDLHVNSPFGHLKVTGVLVVNHLSVFPELIPVSALGLKTSKQVRTSVFLESFQDFLACGKPLKSARKVPLTAARNEAGLN